MDIPLSVLQGLNFKSSKTGLSPVQDSPKSWNPDQFNKSEDHCPLGCDPTRTKLAISKNGKKDKGRFVHVYYRGSKIKQEVPLEVKQEAFWREFNELEERSKTRNRSSTQHDRRTNQGHPGSLRP